ncbi:hypothetical protein EYC84_005432 [Monilinia fructicola]|uniref:Rab-GAP TBC domain-containing protein n=1 Tax=Monilinia fructicola TaxID=38448 RepID=A0A5M9JZE4_MONFR|nr:hypothetical protein EYC84_005432 [Monilinia fructicola]
MESDGKLIKKEESSADFTDLVSPPHIPAETKNHENLQRRKNLATSQDGLISDDLRRQAWPLLLGCGSDYGDTEGNATSWRICQRIGMSIRLLWMLIDLSSTTQMTRPRKRLTIRKEELSDLIVEYSSSSSTHQSRPIGRSPLCASNPRLHAASHLSLLCTAKLDSLHHQHGLSRPLRPPLSNQTILSLSGTLTMYAHDIQEYGDIARLFDVLLAREAVFSVYMFAQIVSLALRRAFRNSGRRADMLHSILSKLPKPLDLESLISNTVELFQAHPPETLPSWRTISSSSVLKTARSPDQITRQSLSDGQRYFAQQVKELQWATKRDKVLEVMWKYRRPARAIGIAVLVGVISYVCLPRRIG